MHLKPRHCSLASELLLAPIIFPHLKRTVSLYGQLLTLGGFPGGSDSKEYPCTVGDPGSIPRLGRFPWRREWLPTPVFLPEEFHGQRSLAGYNPKGLKESDMTEWLSINCVLRPCKVHSLVLRVNRFLRIFCLCKQVVWSYTRFPLYFSISMILISFTCFVS